MYQNTLILWIGTCHMERWKLKFSLKRKWVIHFTNQKKSRSFLESTIYSIFSIVSYNPIYFYIIQSTHTELIRVSQQWWCSKVIIAFLNIMIIGLHWWKKVISILENSKCRRTTSKVINSNNFLMVYISKL